MILSPDNLLSWQTAVWLGSGLCVVALSWRRTQRIFSAWKRVLWRALMISLAFTPTVIPAADELGNALRVPAWYSLFLAVRDSNMVALFAGVVPVLLAGVIFWTFGMAIYLLRNAIRAP